MGPTLATHLLMTDFVDFAQLHPEIKMDILPSGVGRHKHGTLWLLTQGETRKTKRVRLFTEFVSGRLTAHVELLAGPSDP